MNTRDLSSHEPYVPGRGIEEVARELGVAAADLTKLSSNENPYGPSPRAVEAMEAAVGGVHRYPKSSHTDLTAALADEWRLDPAQVWVSPGADGALDYLARATLEPGDGVLVPDPGFAYYAMSARYHNARVETYPVTKPDDFAQSADRVLDAYDGERLVYLTSPHNPSGSEIALDEVRTLAERVDPETLLVVDEAYGEYSAAASARTLLDEYDNVAVTRTFSKAYGLAGLRVGYGLVPASWADAYARVNTPFAANDLACRAANAALDDDDHLRRSVDGARRSRERLRDGLDVRTWPSGGNFVLAEVGDAAAVAEAAKREGVIVRDCGSFGLPGCIRVTAGTAEETAEGVAVLNRVTD
jgi:histidinol-phosphate aminotransferase